MQIGYGLYSLPAYIIIAWFYTEHTLAAYAALISKHGNEILEISSIGEFKGLRKKPEKNNYIFYSYNILNLLFFVKIAIFLKVEFQKEDISYHI